MQTDKILSCFIDESGDFGPLDTHSPYYYVAMVFHEQATDITANIKTLDTHIHNLGYKIHAIHTGPIIRRESFYLNDTRESRRSLFNALYHFTRKLDIHYLCPHIDKRQLDPNNHFAMINKLSKELAANLSLHSDYITNFDRLIVYYDNGQIELTKVLVSVFNTLFNNVEFRKVHPIDYKLFQVADLVCTMEMLSDKATLNSFTNSETEFFGSAKYFKKNLYKQFEKKKL